MKANLRKVVHAGVVVLLAFVGGCVSFFTIGDSFEIMSFNVRHCQGMDKKLDIERTASVINEYSPRFVALQEIDKVVPRSGKVDQAVELGELTDMHSIFAPGIDLQGGQYGVALLSKDLPICYKRYPLPGVEPRVFLLAEFEDCFIGVTHLDLATTNRIKSARIIAEIVKEHNAKKPVFVCGDWNAVRTSDDLAEMRKSVVVISDEYGRTYHGSKAKGPSGLPDDFCIDYIGVDIEHAKDWTVLSRKTIQDQVTSDHKPIIVSVEKNTK